MTRAEFQLSLRNIERRYGENGQWFALRDANLTIRAGEFVAITGPSGAGKSTLLNVLGLLDDAWDGEFSIDGVDVRSLNESDVDSLRSRMIGFVFQSSYVNGYESTARNAALGLSIQGRRLAEQGTLALEALDVVGLADKAASLARTLSGGERQRLGLARALASNPAVILADEPTGNLDSASATRIMSLLRDLNRRGTTVIVVTHDSAVAGYAHRVVEVRDGVLGPGEAQPIQPPPSQPQLSQQPSGRSELGQAEPRLTGPGQRVGRARRRWAALRQWPATTLRAVNNVASRPLRSLTLVAAFTIAIAGLVTASGIGASASQQIAERLAQAALDEVRVGIPADATAEQRHERAANIAALRHVETVGEFDPIDASTAHTARFAGPVSTETFRGTTVAADANLLSLYGVTTTPAGAVRPFGLEDPGRVALVGQGVAKDLGIASPGFGARVWVSGRPYSVIGTITDAPRQPNLLTSVVIPVRTLADPASHLVVRTDTGYSASVAEAIPLALAPAAPGTVRVSTTADLRNLRIGVSEDLSGLLSSVSAALLALAVLGAASAMYLSVQSRIQELALTRALGMSRGGVAGVFIFEGAIVGFAGSLAGLSIGLGAAVSVAAIQGWTAVMPWTALVAAPLIGIVGGAASAVLPAVRAARVDPAEAIR